jgi:tetratricopeptide (TPR) repeat protein
VAWATERRDVLSGLFFLLSLTCYLRAQTNPGKSSKRQWLRYAFIAQLLSLLSKATAMTLPLVLLILDFYPLNRFAGDTRQIFRNIWEKAPFFVLSLVFGVLALFAQQDTGALRPFQQYFLSYRIGQAFYGFCFYLWKTLLPIRLSPLYELPFDFDALTPVFILCGGISIAIGAILYQVRQRWPAVIACYAYYLVVVGPVLGVAQSGPQLVADRYSYLSCLSWALLGGGIFYRCSHGLRQWQGRQIATVASASVIVLTLSAMTWRQTGVWRNTRTLWQHVQEVTPESSLGLFNLGRIYEQEGQLPQAEEFYSRAVKVNPTFADAHYDLARLLARRGLHGAAIEHYRVTLQFKPEAVDAYNNLGLSLASIGDIPASLAQFQKAVQLNPRYAKGFFNLGRVAAQQGDFATAIRNFQTALRMSPDEAEIHFKLGEVLARQGQQEQAVVHFLAAIKLQPEFADAHVALAKSLVILGKKDEAEEHYREALRLLKARTRDPLH